jgi:hypothetical protein
MKNLVSVVLICATLFLGSSVVLAAPSKGIQAVLLHRWGATSARNLANVIRQYSGSEVEVSFAPNTAAAASDPYRNIKKIIETLKGKKTLYVAVYLGFHAYSRSNNCGARAANSDLGQFLTFFNDYKDNPKVKIIVSPSLEDCGTKSDVENSALEIAQQINPADIGKLTLRRSPNGINTEPAPAQCYTNNMLCYKGVEIEKHGVVKDNLNWILNAAGADVYSNDGFFVWDNVSTKRETRGTFKNADGTTDPQYSLTSFNSLTGGKRTNLWRPAYNMYRKGDGTYYADRNDRDFRDVGNRAFNSIEMKVFEKFLGPKPAALGGTVDLSQGDSVSSDNNEVTLMFQTDGNVVLYNNDTGEALWNTRTAGRTEATRFIMQSDGNLVLYAGSTPLWNAGIISPNARLAVQDDHNLVIYSTGGTALWHTGTTNQ